LLRTGREYIEGLRSPRNVWVRGRLVEDVTEYVGFRGCIGSVARLFEEQHEPAMRETLTFARHPGPERASMSLITPRSRADLRRRGAATAAWAELSFGFIGRGPEYMNTAVATFGAAAEWFAEPDPQLGSNVSQYYEYCLSHNPCVAHAAIPPASDRSRASHDQRDQFVHLGVVREVSEGLVVRGAKLIGTMSPIADELVVFPLPGLRPGDEAYAVAFAIPAITPGLRIVCRDPVHVDDGTAGQRDFDARFDEPDGMCIFEDVVVPWERVFAYGDVARANALWDETTARQHTAHQGLARALVKARWMVALAVTIAEDSGARAHLHVQEMLGELIGYVELLAGCLERAESNSAPSRFGVWTPDVTALQAFRYEFPRMYKRIVEVIQVVGGASLINAPSPGSMAEEDLDRFFTAPPGRSSSERAALLRLGWTVTGAAFGQRQLLFERYNAGDPVRLAAQQHKLFPKDAASMWVRDAL
jgi:4-hydroxyphenylacetate 3-monooxygenase oxygenase component